MIDLTAIAMRRAEPAMPDYGVLQTPSLGGAVTRIDRLGGGFTLQFTTPPMPIEPDARELAADCQLGKRKGVILSVPQVDFAVGAPGSGVSVNGAHAGGESLSITGAGEHYAIRKGQALNVTRNGHPYLYYAAAAVTLNGSGAGTVLLTTPLRTQLAGGEAVELAAPKFAGWIQGEVFSLPIEENRTVTLSFDVLEAA